MRTIEIKEVTTAAGEKLDYLELCNACLKTPSQAGYSVDEMEGRLKAIAEFPVVARKANEPKPKPALSKVEVNETVFQELLKCVNGFRWGVLDQVFVDFTRYIQDIANPKVTVVDKEKK